MTKDDDNIMTECKEGGAKTWTMKGGKGGEGRKYDVVTNCWLFF